MALNWNVYFSLCSQVPVVFYHRVIHGLGGRRSFEGKYASFKNILFKGLVPDWETDEMFSSFKIKTWVANAEFEKEK